MIARTALAGASSVGAVEVAPSGPNLTHVGMGDLNPGGGINEGNGVYKSVHAGRTWQHLGLESTKQIPSILVDPHDPNLVMIAAQGDVHKKSERSEEHTSELQSLAYLVCRLLLEKKKKNESTERNSRITSDWTNDACVST